MKKTVLFFVGVCLTVNQFLAQVPSAAFTPIKERLETWDEIRGAWLAMAIQAIAAKQAVPDRTFPEDFTPFEMISMIPFKERNELRQMMLNMQDPGSSTPAQQTDYDIFSALLQHTFCSLKYGRSFGDPHLKSYDRASYSFQTVGEFILSKNENGLFEVQTRQRAQDENFSLNSAVAMNVAGDRLCFYAAEKPDGIQQTPLRLNGQPIQLQGRSYYLPHGGVIRLDGRNYTIAWPTGETTVIDVRSSGSRGFVNITVGIFDCDRNAFEGLLGNNNGFADDDFNSRSNMPRPNNIAAISIASAYAFNSREAEQLNNMAQQEYQAYLAQNFAEDWRVTDNNTLFDYSPGFTTASYTDRSFPRIHMNVAQMNAQSRDRARQRCLQMGVPSDEMGGCIFDQGYLNIAPNLPPVPNIPNPTVTVLNKVERPALNNNAHSFAEGKYPSNRPETLDKPGSNSEKPNSTDKTNSVAKPVQSRESSSPKPGSTINSRPSTPSNSKPYTPATPKPAAPKPAAPRISTPTPKPSMPSSPKPSVKIGKG